MERSSTCDAVRFVAVFLSVLAVARSAPGQQVCSLAPPQEPNLSIANKIVFCIKDDKRCFAHNKIAFEGKCYSVGSPGPCTKSEMFVVDKNAFVEGNVVRGACRPLFPCDRNMFQERMAYDQCCYEVSDIKNNICTAEKNLRLTRNVFGEGVCKSTSQSDIGNYDLRTALSERYCRFPNISFEYQYEVLSYEDRFKHLKVEHALKNVTVKCFNEDLHCFEQDQVRFAGDLKCYPLLIQGPCAPGWWLVLDQGALEAERRVVSVCARPRCLPNQVFMSREQRCRSLEELQRDLCAADDLLFDVFGEAHCGRFTEQKRLLEMPKVREGNSCVLGEPVTERPPYLDVVALPACGPDDHNRCNPPLEFSPESPDDSR